MNLNKFIRIKLTELSKKYDVTLIEIQVAKEEKISKSFRITLKPLYDEDDEEIRESFSSKQKLVSWLLCLK